MGKTKKPNQTTSQNDQEQYQGQGSSSSCSQKSQNKLKKGVAKAKKTNEEGTKKGRSCTGVKLGRPNKSQVTFDVAEDPTSDAQDCLLGYLDNVGLKHGLVFRPEDRARLNLEAGNTINWKPNHEWDRVTQRNKITNNMKNYLSLRKYLEVTGSELSIDDVVDLILSISCLFADECTEQFYNIMSQIFESISTSQPEQSQKTRALSLVPSLKFFTCTFTKLKITYWIEPIKKSKFDKVKQHFVEMFCQLAHHTEIFLTKVEEIRKFLEEQREMDEKLERIIKAGGLRD